MENEQRQDQKLVRGLGGLDTFSLVAGTIIGTGVFLKAATMSQVLGAPKWVLLAWVVGGALSLTGALVYAEIGSLFPYAGGEYVYLREGYGTFAAYLYGWTRFLIGSPATIAAYAMGASSFLAGATNLDAVGGIKTVAISVILFFTFLNCLQVQFGGRVQSFLTMLKVGLIIVLSLGLLFFSQGSFNNFSQSSSETLGAWPGISAFGTAILAALWAYDGWNNLPMIAGEVRDPQKNIPRGLILGLLAVLIVYALIHFAYFYSLSFEEIVSSNSNAYPDALPVAAKAAEHWLGQFGRSALSIMFVISAVGAMNGSIMTSARVPYAMAKDGIFFRPLGTVSEKTHVPLISIVVQAFLACALALWGTFDQLTDYVVFSSWIFYALIMSSLFKFRKQYGKNHQGYKVRGYPWMPVIFMICATFLLINTIYTSPKDSLRGLAVIAAGIPLYFLFVKGKKTAKV